MSNLVTSGPAYCYVSRTAPLPISGLSYNYPASKASIFYLGTCEQPPTLQLNPQWEPIMNDIGGSLLPIDYSYQGEDGLLSLTLNKWNEAIYAAISTNGLGANARGSELWSDIGTIAQLEGVTLQVWLHFPYSTAKSYGASYNLPAGYHFLSCRLAGHVVMPGTRANRRQVILHADRALLETQYAVTSGSNLVSSFRLYDHNMTYIPQVPPVAASGAIP